MSTFCSNLPYGPRSSPAVGLPHSKSIDRPAMKPLPPTRYQYAAHRQAPDAAVRSETNPDNVGWTFEMYSGREHAVNSDSFSRQPDEVHHETRGPGFPVTRAGGDVKFRRLEARRHRARFQSTGLSSRQELQMALLSTEAPLRRRRGRFLPAWPALARRAAATVALCDSSALLDYTPALNRPVSDHARWHNSHARKSPRGS
jgi:hypothetical protein